MWLKKSLEMFNLSKSELSSRTDLRDKKIVEHAVLCDWLRNISNQNIQITRKLTILINGVNSLLEDVSPPADMEIQDGDSSDTESIR